MSPMRKALVINITLVASLVMLWANGIDLVSILISVSLLLVVGNGVLVLKFRSTKKP